MANDYFEHRYLTDDRDLDDRAELVVFFAPNGDYYIGSCKEGERMCRNAVRIRTSGGAAARNPKLVKAVQEVFQALGGWGKSCRCHSHYERTGKHTEGCPMFAQDE